LERYYGKQGPFRTSGGQIMLAKLSGQRYIPDDKEEAFSQLWQLAEDHRTKINDILELLDATASTTQIN